MNITTAIRYFTLIFLLQSPVLGQVEVLTWSKHVHTNFVGSSSNLPTELAISNWMKRAELIPSLGIWGKDTSLDLELLSVYIAPRAGFFAINSTGEVYYVTNTFYDVWWTTNSVGEVVMRNNP